MYFQIMFLIASLMNPFIWNTHRYPKTAERQFLQMCKGNGATQQQCKCVMREGEKAFTIKQAVAQGKYYLKHKKLTDEAWQIHLSCIPEK